MKAQLILADSAASHPDGTISMLRAGVNQIHGQRLRAAMVVRIEAGLGDAGDHSFDLRCIGVDGDDALPPVEGNFQVAKSGGISAFVLAMDVAFTRTGTFVFVLRVDRVQLDEWKIQVTPLPPSNAG